jgi:hypothetical protein
MNRIRRLLTRHPDRRRSAALRLRVARGRFERSTQALRNAALDHIDDQVPIGTMLEATLARLTTPDGGLG